MSGREAETDAVADGDAYGERPLGRVARVRSGYAFRTGVKDDPAGDVRVLQLGDLDDEGRFDPGSLARAAFGGRAERHRVESDDVLLTARGARSVAFRVAADDPVVAAAGLLVISPGASLDGDYLCWYLDHPRTRRRLDRLREGSNLGFLEKKGVERLPVPVPTLAVQREIAGLHAEQRRRGELRLALNAVEATLMNETTWRRAMPAGEQDPER